MARAEKRKSDWVEEFRKNFQEPTEEELKRFREVLEEADELRKRQNIAPLTTGELVRSIRERAGEEYQSS
jgi:hypothetical protein